ncbi:MAG: alanine racemase [Alphaproteobacteria bacterium]|nr:alanine racemase [Alphaproteobacteria bacterium]
MPDLYVPTRPRLEINLDRIRDNFLKLAESAPFSEVSAVVKSNSYGFGLTDVAPALLEAGCRTFWVAHASEATVLRKQAPNAIIYALMGPGSDSIDDIFSLRLRPVINSLSQLRFWLNATTGRQAEPAALHVETGMNRLALRSGDIPFAVENWAAGKLNLSLLMSHLACANTPDHPKNREQLTRFKEIKKLFPNVPTSLAASYALYLGKEFQQDVIRVGRAMYGIQTAAGSTAPVFKLSAPVIQTANISVGEIVGYLAAWQALRPSRIATLAIGYTDGMPTLLSNCGEVYFSSGDKTYAAPITGRVSMDLICCDVTDIPESVVQEGVMADLITYENYVEKLASKSGMIDYEIMTHLGNRPDRVYIHTAATNQKVA